MKPKMTNEQATYLMDKRHQGLIIMTPEEEGWMFEHVDGIWLWQHTEPAEDMVFVDYGGAWRDMLKRLDGKIDGVSFAAERGHNAQRELDQLLEVDKMVKEIADEYDIEASVYDIEEEKHV